MSMMQHYLGTRRNSKREERSQRYVWSFYIPILLYHIKNSFIPLFSASSLFDSHAIFIKEINNYSSFLKSFIDDRRNSEMFGL